MPVLSRKNVIAFALQHGFKQSSDMLVIFHYKYADHVTGSLHIGIMLIKRLRAIVSSLFYFEQAAV
ncbi:hypothetical protein D3C81_2108090 [compost metagenome]